MASPQAPVTDDAPFERPPVTRRTLRVTGAVALAVAAALALGLALRPAALSPDAAPTPRASDTAALLPVGEGEGDGEGRDGDGRPAGLLGSWTPLPEAPLGPRWGAQAVWTGTEAIVWGGYSRVPPDGLLSEDSDPRTFPAGVLAELAPLRDGAAFDPSTGSWRAIEVAPENLSAGARALWTGEELLVLGGEVGGPAGAWAYDPTLDAWRSLPPGPLPLSEDAVLVWTGSEALIWSGGPPGEPSSAAALDPRSGRWRTTAAGPPLGFEAVSTWTGQELLVWDETSGTAYDPAADTWRPLDDPPAAMRAAGRVAVAVGDDVLLAGAYPRLEFAAYGYRYRPSAQRWDVQPLPEPPDEQFPAISAATLDDEHAVVLHRYGRGASGGEAFRWTRAGGAWERLTHNPVLERLATAEVWSGEELIVWGGLADEPQAGGAAWRPDPPP